MFGFLWRLVWQTNYILKLMQLCVDLNTANVVVGFLFGVCFVFCIFLPRELTLKKAELEGK